MPPQLSFWFPGSGPTPGEGEAVHITGKTLFLVFFLRMEGVDVLIYFGLASCWWLLISECGL